MAVYSMTGYASATAGAVETPVTQIHSVTEAPAPRAASGGNVNVELRSVNGRFLDLVFRLPDEFRSLEPALREQLTKTFRRGKIELRINARTSADSAWPQPQTEQLNRLTRLESTVQGWFPNAQSLSVHEVLQWCKGAAPAEKLDEMALDAGRRCIAGLRESRAREGKRLVAVLLERIDHLRRLADQAEPLVPATVKRQQQRFLERWQEALAHRRGRDDRTRRLQERALNEAAAYATGSMLRRNWRGCGPSRRGGPTPRRWRRGRQAARLLIQELLREVNRWVEGGDAGADEHLGG